jgi:NAD(P)-dependent dehydrogenase (short-subunit alcohol dehydrogenase family)
LIITRTGDDGKNYIADIRIADKPSVTQQRLRYGSILWGSKAPQHTSFIPKETAMIGSNISSPVTVADPACKISRRTMLRRISVATAAALAGNGAIRSAEANSAKSNRSEGVVLPSPVYFPTRYRREMDLRGKNIVVTGASRGIGRVTALDLVSAGANVWGTSRTPAAYPAVTEYPLIALDIEKPTSIGAFIPAIGAATAGRVDVLINNAGRLVFGSTTPVSPDPAAFALWAGNSALALQNLYLGHRSLTFAMLGLMQHPGYRRILFTASSNAYASGADLGSYMYQPYVAGKRAILDFANSLRAWFALIGLDIGVGTVNPAATRTDLVLPGRPIYLEAVDANDNPDPASPLAIFLPLFRTALENAQPPGVVGRAYRQMLELNSPPPNVLAVIPDGPNSTAAAAQLSLLLATRQKEEQVDGAMPWAIRDRR